MFALALFDQRERPIEQGVCRLVDTFRQTDASGTTVEEEERRIETRRCHP
jgi:hypothetical protein